MRVAPMVWGCLVGWVLASIGRCQVPEAKPPALEVPIDLRAALFALPVQPPPASGVTVRVVDDASKAAIAGAHVFVPDQAKWQAIAPRVPKSPNDIERMMLAALLWASDHYVTGADGTVLVTASAQPFAYAVTADGLGMAGPDRTSGADVKQIEARVLRVETFVVRAQSANGKALAGLGVEIGPYGERGNDRFEPMLTDTTDERGEVRMRMPGLMARSFLSKGARLCAQARVVGAEPVRVALAAATAETSTVVLGVPPLGRVIVRLHDEHEKPQSGIEIVCLHRAGETPPHRAPEQMPTGWEKPSGDRGDEVRFDVALGQKLVARIRGAGIAGEVVHEQDGPTHEGELVVFAARAKAASPIVQLRLCDAAGKPLGKQPVAVLFLLDQVAAQNAATTTPDGTLRIAVPEAVATRASRICIVRRDGANGADTVYGGAVVHDLAADAKGLRTLGDLRLQEEPVAIAGRLVDRAGVPVAGVTVRMGLTRDLDAARHAPSQDPRDLLGRAMQHRATSDREGRFVFREIDPAYGAMQFAIVGGEWVVAPDARLTAGLAEQKIVVQRCGTMRLTFRSVPPKRMRLQLQYDGKDHRAIARTDDVTGARSFDRLPPGRYTVLLFATNKESLRIDGIDVPAGEACADARLADIDWAAGLRTVRMHLHDKDGRAVGNTTLKQLNAKDMSVWSVSPVSFDGDVLAMEPSATQLVFGQDRFETVLVTDPGEAVDLTFVPRRRVRLTLPKELELPAGLAVQFSCREFPGKHGPMSRAVWTGAGTEVLADGVSSHRLVLCTAERGGAKVLWSCDVAVTAGTEPFEFELPITAEELKDVREKIAAAKPATSKGR